VWLVCKECGYTKEILFMESIEDNNICPRCDNEMIQDLNEGRKLEELPGDNFPKSVMDNNIFLKDRINKNFPKITIDEILDFVNELQLKTVDELLNKND
jgi:predicted RNA-binding Zn-ribbon protein involved in translation (DUF1610 family)